VLDISTAPFNELINEGLQFGNVDGEISRARAVLFLILFWGGAESPWPRQGSAEGDESQHPNAKCSLELWDYPDSQHSLQPVI
jgi:hypothetical protein